MPSQAPSDPEDWQERWIARVEKRIDDDMAELRKAVFDRLESIEKSFREHVEKSGHASESDLRSRMNRLEAGVVGLLMAVVTEAVHILTGGK